MTVDDTGFREARLAATAAAIAGDSGGLYRLVSGLMDEGVPFEEILFGLLLGTEYEVGARWQQGDYLVSEEHAATATVETVVSLLAGSFDQPTQGVRVVVAVAEGDHHSLPARAVAAYLLFLGFRTTFLGANVLSSDLHEYLVSDPPRAVVLSCAMSTALPGARAAIKACHDAGVPVLVGGQAFGEQGKWVTAIGADGWVSSAREVPDKLASWNPDIRAAEAQAVEASPEVELLTDEGSALLASARKELATLGLDASDPRLVAELRLLLQAVIASLLVDDDQVIVDMLRWQETTMAAHGYEGSDLVAAALRSALEGLAPSAREALGRAVGAR